MSLFLDVVVALIHPAEHIIALPDVVAHLAILSHCVKGIDDLVETDGIGQQGIGIGSAVKRKGLAQFVKSGLQVFTDAFKFFRTHVRVHFEPCLVAERTVSVFRLLGQNRRKQCGSFHYFDGCQSVKQGKGQLIDELFPGVFVIAGFPDMVFEHLLKAQPFGPDFFRKFFDVQLLGFTDPQPGEMFIKSRLNEVTELIYMFC